MMSVRRGPEDKGRHRSSMRDFHQSKNSPAGLPGARRLATGALKMLWEGLTAARFVALSRSGTRRNDTETLIPHLNTSLVLWAGRSVSTSGRSSQAAALRHDEFMALVEKWFRWACLAHLD